MPRLQGVAGSSSPVPSDARRGVSPLPTPELERIQACQKACEGIPTSLLQEGFIVRLVAACLHIEDRRIQDVLNELVGSAKRSRKLRADS